MKEKIKETTEETGIRATLDDIIARGLIGDSELSAKGFKELFEYVKSLRGNKELIKELEKERDRLRYQETKDGYAVIRAEQINDILTIIKNKFNED